VYVSVDYRVDSFVLPSSSLYTDSLQASHPPTNLYRLPTSTVPLGRIQLSPAGNSLYGIRASSLHMTPSTNNCLLTTTESLWNKSGAEPAGLFRQSACKCLGSRMPLNLFSARSPVHFFSSTGSSLL